MLKKIVLLIISFIIMVSCASKQEDYKGVLIKKYFREDGSFVVVCKGNALKDSVGPARKESARRTALLNAYYFIREEFTQEVAPDRDGMLESIKYSDDYAVIEYVVRKKGLKKYRRQGRQ